MAILYLDGKRFYRGFVAGSRRVKSSIDYLNKINVFPVADSDTGANLSATLQNILSSTGHESSLKLTTESLANKALEMARGNSGIIFSQYLYGLSRELKSEKRLTVLHFSEAVHRAVNYMYKALVNPVEGTMITVIKDWAESMLHFSSLSSDLLHVFEKSLERARSSLLETRNRLKVLKKAGVVDAGGMGFVMFLEGVIGYLKTGKLEEDSYHSEPEMLEEIREDYDNRYRYCCETLLTNLQEEPEAITSKLQELGDSIVTAGGRERLHLHVHSNEPEKIFQFLAAKADIGSVKVDDMKWQHQILEKRKYNIGLVTDSAADFPEEYKERYQISRIPIKLIFGNDIYLDKVTIDSRRFFDKIENGKIFPHSSQPDPSQVGSTLDFVKTHYDKVICLSVSGKLSGVNNLMGQAAGDSSKIEVFDSHHLSVSQGLLVLRTAEAIEAGMSYSDIRQKLPEWRKGTWIFTDIQSLDYLVRGGRISPLKGKIAGMLNLKPIVTVDEEGKGAAWGKSFTRSGNMKKILRLVQEKAEKGKLWNYAIVHSRAESRAESYAAKLEKILGKKPLYVMDVGPVVGVHNGLGATAVGLLVEE